ncbi:MAG: HEPN domain-containing protein [Nitrospirae bacterium]|nr:HEPN domain-containing protein [Magnetococcales bacterium]
MKPPHIEEALRTLRLVDRDVIAFETLRDSPRASLASACFHAQQAVEKYIKAVLFQNQIEFRRTHDLTVLTRLLEANRITSPVPDGRLKTLNPCAVDFR